MITLTKTKDLIKKNLWLFIAVLTIFAILGLVTLKIYLNEKALTPLIAKPTFEKTIIGTSKFNLDQLVIPSNTPNQLPVYNVNRNSLLESASVIANQLGFQESPTILNDINLGKGLAYSNETGSLVIYNEELAYNKYSPKPTSGSFHNKESLRSLAEKFFESINLTVSLSLNPSISYYRLIDEFLTKTENVNEAALATITLRPVINEYEIILPGSEIAATFNKNNSLVSIIYKPINTDAQSEKYPIINGREAASALIQNKGSIVKIEAENDYNPPPTSLETVTIKEAYLAYYLSLSEPKHIQPVWIFKGETITKEGKIDVSYAIPAIEQSFLREPQSPKP